MKHCVGGEAVAPGPLRGWMAGNRRIHSTRFQAHRFRCLFQNWSKAVISNTANASHAPNERPVDAVQRRIWPFVMNMIAWGTRRETATCRTTGGDPRF